MKTIIITNVYRLLRKEEDGRREILKTTDTDVLIRYIQREITQGNDLEVEVW